MLVLLFLCINLLVIEHSVCYDFGFSCNSSEDESVYLLQPKYYSDSGANKLNFIFFSECEHFYNIQTVRVEAIGISNTLKAIETKKNVINLWAHDYYNHEFKDGDHDKVIYAGDVEPDISSETYDDNRGIYAIRKNNDYKRLAKVVSNTVANMSFGDLLEFVESIQYYGLSNIRSRRSCVRQATKTAELRTVLICTDKGVWNSCFGSNKPYHGNIHFKVVNTSECAFFVKHLQNNILAVLAPKPFNMNYEIAIPMIFYETPYMNAEYETYFPNSMNLISSSLLKYAFMKFINDAEWRRVAIISDNSPYSTEFEKELLDMFRENKIIYNVQRCENRDDFEKAVKFLWRVDARIVIVNFDEKNAEKLTKIESRGILNKFVLLFRVPPFWGAKHEYWFSIVLGSPVLGNDGCSNNLTTCAGLVHALNVVTKAHAVQQAPEDLQRATFYRNFTNTMKEKIHPGSIANVTRTKCAISELHIDKDGAITQTIEHKKPFDNPILDQAECFAKVNNFNVPCDYSIYLYIMFVIMIFAITFLIITCYFHETSPLFSKTYQQL